MTLPHQRMSDQRPTPWPGAASARMRQAIPNAHISYALCMLFDLERCRRLDDVRFGTPPSLFVYQTG